jgi:hypothetical protein
MRRGRPPAGRGGLNSGNATTSSQNGQTSVFTWMKGGSPKAERTVTGNDNNNDNDNNNNGNNGSGRPRFGTSNKRGFDTNTMYSSYGRTNNGSSSSGGPGDIDEDNENDGGSGKSGGNGTSFGRFKRQRYRNGSDASSNRRQRGRSNKGDDDDDNDTNGADYSTMERLTHLPELSDGLSSEQTMVLDAIRYFVLVCLHLFITIFSCTIAMLIANDDRSSSPVALVLARYLHHRDSLCF